MTRRHALPSTPREIQDGRLNGTGPGLPRMPLVMVSSFREVVRSGLRHPALAHSEYRSTSSTGKQVTLGQSMIWNCEMLSSAILVGALVTAIRASACP